MQISNALQANRLVLIFVVCGTAFILVACSALCAQERAEPLSDYLARGYPARIDLSLGPTEGESLKTRMSCTEQPFKLLLKALQLNSSDQMSQIAAPKLAYVIHMGHWNNRNGSYAMVDSKWYVYHAVTSKGQCYFQQTGFKANGQPLLYGDKTFVFLGINRFELPVDARTLTLGYKVAITPDVPENLQDLGLLLAAILGGTPSTGGLLAVVPNPYLTDTFITAARVQGLKRLPFLLNFTFSMSLTQFGRLLDARIGVPYSGSISASGGSGAYTFVLAEGSDLPPGLGLDATTGVISGIPTGSLAENHEYPINVYVRDQSLTSGSPLGEAMVKSTITVVPGVVVPMTSPTGPKHVLSSGMKNISYQDAVTSTAGANIIKYSIQGGNLPPGLVLDHTTGRVGGMPTTPGLYEFTVLTEDEKHQTNTAVAQISITETLPAGSAGDNYFAGVAGSGGSGNFTYALKSGNLPAGLSLSPTTGAISGRPINTGDYVFTVRISDAVPSQDASKQPAAGEIQAGLHVDKENFQVGFGATIEPQTQGLPPGNVNLEYQAQVQVTGGSGKYVYAIEGKLPEGLSLDSHTGRISGIPKVVGKYSVAVKVTDAGNPKQSAKATYSVEIAAAVAELGEPTLSLSISRNPNFEFDHAVVGVPYAEAVALIHQAKPCAACSCTLADPPPGFKSKIVQNLCLVTGTPASSGRFKFAIIVADDQSSAYNVYPAQITVIQPQLTITLGGGTGSNASSPRGSRSPGGNSQPSSSNSSGQQASTKGAGTTQPSGGTGAANSAVQSVDCSALTAGSPCTFNRTLRSDDREAFDFSIAVSIPGVREQVFSSPTASSSKTHTDLYGMVDLYPFARWHSKESAFPHLNVGIPVTSQPFYRPYFGVGETLTSWTKLEKIGFPLRIGVFAGITLMKQQIVVAGSNGAGPKLKGDRAMKGIFGIELPVAQLVSKIGGGGSKAQGGKGGGKSSGGASSGGN